MTHDYRVILPVSFEDDGGGVHHPGEVITLEAEQAVRYSHALIAVEEGDEDGRRA